MSEEYFKPSVAADIVVIDSRLAPWRDNGTIINLCLIKRDAKADAFPDCWALPGGFLDKGESIEQCAVRELKEETGLDAKMLAPVMVSSNPTRDPRGQVISHAFVSVFMSTEQEPIAIKAGDDAAEVEMFRLKGNFNPAIGALEVVLKNVAKKVTIAFKAEFSRGWMGLVDTKIEENKQVSNASLAFNHAEIIARTILRMPDLVKNTSPKEVEIAK